MESLGFSHLPLRLTKLYSDTKRSCDVVTEPEKVANVPELTSLHRKFRNQKDRLVAWGVEWSDDSVAAQGSIDESVARAGLTEVVTSVLGSIKEVLDEAEKIRCSDKPAAGSFPSEKGMAVADQGRRWSPSDKSRYEDLVKDLASSVDILYDLSRSRRAMQQSQLTMAYKPSMQSPMKPKARSIFSSEGYSSSAETLVNPPSIAPSRSSLTLEAPSRLDPKCLILAAEDPPPYESIGAAPSSRMIGRLRRQSGSNNPIRPDGTKAVGVSVPVLIEFAEFDAGYRETGVTPPLDRLERLLDLLRPLAESTDASPIGTLNCLGYFEDPNQPRFGLVFELPSFVYGGSVDVEQDVDAMKPATLLSLLQASSRQSQPNPQATIPPLEERFRMAYRLVQGFSRVHDTEFTHKDLNSSNVLVFRNSKSFRSSAMQISGDFAVRSPFLASFDLFSEFNIEPRADTFANIYRHPNDPRLNVETGGKYSLEYEIYSLGLILLEIGLWLPLSDIYKPKYTLGEFKLRLQSIWVKKLASKCGTAYMRVVQDCLAGTSSDGEGLLEANQHRQLYDRMLERLRRCCMLDDSEPVSEIDIRGSWSKPLPTSASVLSKIEASIPEEDESEPRPLSKSSSSSFRQVLSPLKKRKQSSSFGSPLTKSVSEPNMHKTLSLSKFIHRTSPSEEKQEAASLRTLEEVPEPPSPRNYNEYLERRFGSVYSASEPDLSTLYRDAVTVIQRAWRSHREHLSYKEYRRKVVIIQSYWRNRRDKRQASQTCTPPSFIEEAISQPPQLGQDFSGANEALGRQFSIQIEPQEMQTRPKLRLFPVKLSPTLLDEWHANMLPRLERIIGKALRDSSETVSIDLVGIGDSQTTARPTIFITCSSTGKVKAAIQRRFSYDQSVFDLKVRRGKIRRSKVSSRPNKGRRPPHRSMMHDTSSGADFPVLNPYHQERPLCGASIGAFKDEHLPPVSYGGIVLVDGQPLGMSVHHLLDAPSDDESESGDLPNDSPTRSFASINGELSRVGSSHHTLQNLPEAVYPPEISDDEYEPYDEAGYDSQSDAGYGSSGEDSDNELEAGPITPGDIPGVEVGEGADIVVTQPAIDDVEEDFFPNREDRDEDHLSSHALGHIHASSGIKRCHRLGITHEIDWSLFKLNKERIQLCNLVQGGKRFCPHVRPPRQPRLLDPVCRRHFSAEEDLYPYQIAKSNELGNLAVHCFGRTSGLRGGTVGPAMSSVRIYRRRTFSRSWHVVGGFGVGGDSGAWVIDNEQGRVCGHVLAWCERNAIAYICPMEILLEDMKTTLGAQKICLPGGEDLEDGSSPTAPTASASASARRTDEGGISVADFRRVSIDSAHGSMVKERMQFGRFDKPANGHTHVSGGSGRYPR